MISQISKLKFVFIILLMFQKKFKLAEKYFSTQNVPSKEHGILACSLQSGPIPPDLIKQLPAHLIDLSNQYGVPDKILLVSNHLLS
jgi:hypothetical protein